MFVLIMEDAESLIRSRELPSSLTAGSATISGLLNLADGLLGAIFQVHIIVTANTELDELDEAILRPGRLRTCYEFEPLNLEEARRLSEELQSSPS